MSRSFIFIELYICKLYTCRPFAGRKCAGNFCRDIYFDKLQVYISIRKILRIYIVLPEKFHKNIFITQKFYKNIVRQKYISTSKILQIYIYAYKYIFLWIKLFLLYRYTFLPEKVYRNIVLQLNWILIEEFVSRLFMSIKLLNYVLENDLEIGG